MEIRKEGDELIICPEGRIHSDNVKDLEKEINEALEANSADLLTFDMDRVSYISSAGLRMFLGFSKRYKDRMTICSVSPEVYDIFSVTGFNMIMKVEKKPREISIDGCTALGKGAFGTVYRLDKETIVKVYAHPDSKKLIEEGQDRARYAFMRGIPTAIAFDRVKVGENDGAVFELLDAASFQGVIHSEPDKLEEMTQIYLNFLDLIHNVEAERSGDLEDARNLHLVELDKLKGLIPEDTIEGIRSLLLSMPEDLHIVHGDLHMKNLMFCGGEPMVIDMDTLCVGNSVFEIGRLATFYKIIPDTDKGFEKEFFGFPNGSCAYIWNRILEPYSDSAAQDKLMLIGYLNMAEIVSHKFPEGSEYRKLFLPVCAENLKALLARIDSLVLS